jgi:hypothetical protein
MTLHLLDFSFPAKPLMKNIIFHFKPVQIYIPWYMDPPDYIVNDPAMPYSYPPESLKPEERFGNILTECLNWVKQNNDKSHKEIIKSGYSNSSDDNSTWQIRQLLGDNIPSGSTFPEDNSVKWHLILHLAKEMETQLLEANRILHNLRHRPPLLDKSVETAVKTEYLLGDLYGFDQESTLNHTRLSRIIEAWFGLFGSLIPETAILLTSNSTIFNHILEQWKILLEDINISNLKSVSFRLLPPLSNSDSEKQKDINRGDIIEEKLEEIKNLIYSLGGAPLKNGEALDRLSMEYDTLLQEKSSPAFLQCTVKYLHPISRDIDPQINTYIKYFFGRTIILIEKG